MAHKLKLTSWHRATDPFDSTIKTERSAGSSNSSEKVNELQYINEDAEKAADTLIAELQHSHAENRAKTAQLRSILAKYSIGSSLNLTELSQVAKSAAINASKSRLAQGGNEPKDDQVFSDTIPETASEGRAVRCLASEVRRVANRSSRLAKEVAALQNVVRTSIHFETPNPTDVIEWRGESSQIEEKVKILKKKLDSLPVPTQFSLKKRHDECMALHSELNATQERLRQYAGLPPSIAEAAAKLEEAGRELKTLKSEIRNLEAKSFGLSF